MAEQNNLATGSLSTLESVVMGVAGSAPAFSVAVTTATIVASVGTLSVGSIFYCGFIMFGIMLAFIHLNEMKPHAGATYAWVGRVFGPNWGFFAGWGLLVASVVFMVSATIPAATSTLVLFAPDYVENTNWVTLVAAIWLTVVTIVVTKGIRHASNAQMALTFIETGIVVALILGALYYFAGTPAHTPSLEWISPSSFTPTAFATGALTAIFFYWGWDVTLNLGEETKKGTPQPSGQGAFWAMIALMIFYMVMLITVLIALSDEEIAAANTNVLYALANKVFSSPWSYMAVLSTILSTVGTIETQILQFSRTMFAMARDDALNPRYATIHPEWQTPWIATGAIWLLGMILLFSSSYMPTVSAILQASILAIGFQICFYMSLAAFACAWQYRDKLNAGFVPAISYVLWPLLSGLFMVFVALYSIPTFDTVTNVIGIGGLLVGFIPLMMGKMRRQKQLAAA